MFALVAALAATLGLAPTAAHADKDSDRARARLTGFEETPLTLSSPARGRIDVRFNDESLRYTLTYDDIASGVLQAHFHFGQRATTGGISVFLCTILANGPAGTPACPSPGGTVSGTLTSASVVGPAAQGIAPGELAELLAAIRAGFAYANVHSTAFPSGEIRGQLKSDDD
jgi:hypothetical protein